MILSKELFGDGYKQDIPQEVLNEARIQTVSSLISDDYQMIANNIRIDTAHAKLTEIMGEIPFVTLKGFASAYYYPDPIKRTMGDVDFYVAPQNYDAAAEKLTKAGLSPMQKEHERHESFRMGNVIFELHSEIKGVPNGKDGIKSASVSAEKIVRHYLDDIVETAQNIDTQHGKIIIPDQFHHGLIMLLHVAAHIINDGGVGLRHLCDWAVYVDKVDISRFEQRFRKIGIWTFACQLTAVSAKYLGLQKTYNCETFDDEFLQAFIDDILSAGNFGKKTGGRTGSFYLVKEKNYFTSFIAFIKKKYRFCNDKPFLIPVAILIFTYNYLKLRLSGKRKWIHQSNLNDAKQRLELYKQFKLFQ